MSHYPSLSIIVSAVVAYIFATLFARLLVRAGFRLPPDDRRIGCIDGLRGYLALSVAIHHFIFWLQFARLGDGWSPLKANLFSSLGNGAVALFFMITGLVFYPRVLAGFRGTSWVTVYLSRIFRLLPLAAVSVAIATGVIMFRTGKSLDASFPGAALQWIIGWSEPTLLGYEDSGRLNFYVLWSLWYEWLFYIFVLPICAFGMDSMRNRFPSWMLPGILLLGSLALRHRVGGLMVYLPLFAIGMLAFESQRDGSIREWFRRKWVAPVAILSLVVGMLSAPTPYSVLQLPFYGFFFVAVACGNDLFGALRTKGSLLFGESSYGIYLLHGIILNVLFVEGASITSAMTINELPALIPIVALAVTGISAVTYAVIERPAMRAGALLARRLKERQIPDNTSMRMQ